MDRLVIWPTLLLTNDKKGSHSNVSAHETPNSYANLSSLMTSRVDGMASPVPGTGRRSNRETAKDRAVEQARVALHLRNHAASTLPWRRCGADCALALARADKNCAVSTLQRPPTSAASTTKRARPPSPDSSGYVASFLLLALCSAAPSWLAALLEADPSRERPTSCQLPAVPLAISSSHLQPLPTSARLKR